MRILYIASVRIPNEKASGLAIMRQCEAFTELGHKVTLLRPYRSNHIEEDVFSYYGIAPSFKVETMSSIDFSPSLGLVGFAITRISQMIGALLCWFKNRRSIDLVYARDPWMLALILLSSKRTRLIWEAHQAQKGLVVRYVARHVNRLICISMGLKEYLHLFSGRTDVIVEPSGVNLKQFEKIPSQQAVRKKFGLPLAATIIGYIGKYTTMGEDKGVDDLIHAFSLIQQREPGTHLLIVGLEEEEEDLVRGVCSKVSLPKYRFTLLPLIQKNFAEYIQATDVLVMNYPDTEHYRNYMSPTKLFAYMASRKKVIASNLPSVRSIADDSMITFVEPGDIENLAEGMETALAIKDDSKQECAYRRMQEFDWLSRGERILHF